MSGRLNRVGVVGISVFGIVSIPFNGEPGFRIDLRLNGQPGDWINLRLYLRTIQLALLAPGELLLPFFEASLFLLSFFESSVGSGCQWAPSRAVRRGGYAGQPKLAGKVLCGKKSYQRESRRGPPRPPPPPLPPRLSVLGRASFTFNARPSTLAPFKALIARSASSPLVISTNAKPRDRPVSRSVTMLTRSTAPYSSNHERTEASVARKSRLPTKMFFKVVFFPIRKRTKLIGLRSRPKGADNRILF